jgi:hypothetical protein
VRQKRASYEIQFTPASILSKNPEEKINQISSLAQQGIIDKGMIADLLQIPDIEKAESTVSASYHYCQRIIKNAVKDEDYDYLETVDYQMLLKECIKALNVMYANGDKAEYCNRVKKLLEKVIKDIQGMAILAKPPAPPPAPTPFEPLKDYNFDAGQIQALKDLAISVNDSQLPPGTAIAIVQASYPKIPQELLNSMFTPLEKFDKNVAPTSFAGVPPVSPMVQPSINAQ